MKSLAIIHLLFRALLAIALAAVWPVSAQTTTPSYEQPGPHRAQVVNTVWIDATRKRSLLIKVRMPSADSAPGARPVVLFSHGLGGSIEAGRLWGEHWASFGIVVIHLQHPGSDESAWKGANRPALALRKAASGEQLIERARDVSFVLSELERRNASDALLAGRLDLGRIGVSGHSFGAQTTQAIAGQTFPGAERRHGTDQLTDNRPRAFIAFSPSARNDDAADQFKSITRPFFSITGTRDGKVGMAGFGIGVEPELRVLPYQAMPAGGKYLLNLTDADHMIFAGQGRWRTTEKQRGPAPDPARDALHEKLVRTMTTAFWLTHLADDAAAKRWLDGAARYVTEGGRLESK